MQLITTILLLTTLLFVPNKTVAAEPLFQESVVWQPGEDGYWPHFVYGLVVTNNQTILAFAEGRIEPADDGAKDLLLKRSTDSGQTWGEDQHIVTSSGGSSFGNPTPVVDSRTGKIFLFYGENFDNLSSKVYYKVSSDDGLTWSEPHDITPLFTNNTLFQDTYGWTFHLPALGHGIEHSSGRLMLAVWHRKAITVTEIAARNYSVSVIYSDDGGATWQNGGHIPPGLSMSESRIGELDNGDIIMSSRTFNKVRGISKSTDRGLTWSTPYLDTSLSPANDCDSGMITIPPGADEDFDRILFSRPDTLNREQLSVKISYDGGATWRHQKLASPGTAYYNDLVLLPDNTVGLLYGKGGTNGWFPEHVAFARFNLEWLTDGQDTLTHQPTPIPGDLNTDGKVDIFDYQKLITNFGNPYTIFDYQKIISNFDIH